MKIHVSSAVNRSTIRDAAQVAHVSYELTHHGSRKSHHAFNVTLTGSSNRRPNGGNCGAGDEYAATWDQWGVFFAVIFEVDPEASCYAYAGAEDFHDKTSDRFNPNGDNRSTGSDFWPADAHGDHTWSRVNGRSCTKCSASRW